MRNKKPIPDLSVLKECFDVVDGFLIWRDRPRSHFKSYKAFRSFNARAGKKAGGVVDGEYWKVYFLGSRYKAHRIIYEMCVGKIPDGAEIDHINGVKTDNRPENLRIATSSNNSSNRKNRSDNSCGVKGVWFCNTKKKFLAQVMSNGIKRTEKFNSLADAESWVVLNRKEMHGDFANNGIHTGELK